MCTNTYYLYGSFSLSIVDFNLYLHAYFILFPTPLWLFTFYMHTLFICVGTVLIVCPYVYILLVLVVECKRDMLYSELVRIADIVCSLNLR